MHQLHGRVVDDGGAVLAGVFEVDGLDGAVVVGGGVVRGGVVVGGCATVGDANGCVGFFSVVVGAGVHCGEGDGDGVDVLDGGTVTGDGSVVVTAGVVVAVAGVDVVDEGG